MIGGTRPGGGVSPFPLGAATYLVLEDRLSTFTESWPLVIGVIFALFVLFLPRGIWGTLTGGFHGRQGA
jgi:branched-chain amino acid transport system permease protein